MCYYFIYRYNLFLQKHSTKAKYFFFVYMSLFFFWKTVVCDRVISFTLLYFSLPCLEIAPPRFPRTLSLPKKIQEYQARRPKAEGTTTTNTYLIFPCYFDFYLSLCRAWVLLFSFSVFLFFFATRAPPPSLLRSRSRYILVPKSKWIFCLFLLYILA